MNELIAIENREGKETVNARDLHTFLEVQSRFNDWIKNRIEKYEFIENADFICLTKTLVTQREGGQSGSASQVGYFLSLDMAKELSMVENNEKGKEARKYFIEVEKRSRAIVRHLTVAEILQENVRLIGEYEKKIEVMTPKADFYDTVTQSEDTFDMATVVKTLNLGVGRNELYQLLRDKRILMATNAPYQEYVDRGYFKIVEMPFTTPDGKPHIGVKTVVYQKGVDYIRKVILAK